MIRLLNFIFFTLLLNIQLSYCQNSSITTSNQQSKNVEIYTAVEKNPTFIGGQSELIKYINHKLGELISPDEIEVEGSVILQFVVEKDGNLSDIKVARGLSKKENETAILIVESMPKWEPGRQRGIPVNVRYTMPISFKKK